MRPGPKVEKLLSTLLLVMALAVVLKSAHFTVTRSGLDFVQLYFGGQLAAQGEIANIHDTEAYAPMIAELSEHNARISPSLTCFFNRPAFAAYLYVPLAFLSFEQALIGWTAFNILLLGLFAWKVPDWLMPNEPFHFPVRACLLVFLPFHHAILEGHDTILLSLILAFAISKLRNGNDVIAGIVMALGLFKPHLLWVLPIALAFDRRWKGLLGFALGGFTLAAMSFGLIGWNGVEQWWQLLQAPSTDYNPIEMANIRGMYLLYGGVPAGLLSAMIAVSGGFLLWKGDWRNRYAAALLMGPLLNIHTFLYDYSLAAIAACLVARRNRTARIAILVPWLYLTVSAPGTPVVAAVTLTLGSLAYSQWTEARGAGDAVAINHPRGSLA